MCEPVSVQEVPPEEQEVLGVETICPLSFPSLFFIKLWKGFLLN